MSSSKKYLQWLIFFSLGCGLAILGTYGLLPVYQPTLTVDSVVTQPVTVYPSDLTQLNGLPVTSGYQLGQTTTQPQTHIRLTGQNPQGPLGLYILVGLISLGIGLVTGLMYHHQSQRLNDRRGINQI